MPFSEHVKVMVWGLEGARCAFTDCNKLLVIVLSEDPPRQSVLGEAAHIVSESPNGPRGESPLTTAQRNAFENAILMCFDHHAMIDDHPDIYPVALLAAWKKEHEERFRHSGSFDGVLLADRARYAEYVDEWIRRGHIEEWTQWTSFLVGGDWPRLAVDMEDSLQQLSKWVFSRVWPGRYKQLEKAFTNFRLVLADLLRVFHQHSERSGDQWQTVKFYRDEKWLPEREFNQGLLRYEFHCDLITDLVLEFTRAANLICDCVREYIDPEFRIREGVLTIEMGPFLDFGWKTFRPEYKGRDRTDLPYSNLKSFKAARHTRDISFGRGTNADAPDALENLVRRHNALPDFDE